MLHKYQNNELLLFKFSQWKDFSTSRVADFTRFDVRWRLRVSGETEDDLPPKLSLMIGQSLQDLTRLRSSAQVRERKRGVGGKVEKTCQVGWEPRHWAVPTALPSPHHHSSLGYKQPLLLLVLLNSNLKNAEGFCLFICLFWVSDFWT